MMDTTSDCNKHEQTTICVRIASESGILSEHLLGMQRLDSTKASE